MRPSEEVFGHPKELVTLGVKGLRNFEIEGANVIFSVDQLRVLVEQRSE